MSPSRTLRTRIPAQLTLAVAGSAVALTAVVSGASALAVADGPPAVTRTGDLANPAPPSPAPGSDLTAVSPAALPPPLVDAQPGSMVLVAYTATSSATPRHTARGLLRRFHWRPWQFKYLNRLWDRESGWNKYASNPYSGAYGIPQAVPGSKMASAGPNWQSNARTQILWGLRYIKGRYRSPYQAWQHEVAYGWY